MAEALHVKSLVVKNQGQYGAAAEMLEEELALLQRLGGKAPPIMTFRAKSALAPTYSFFMGRSGNRARSLYLEAIALANRDQSIPRAELASLLADWGSTLRTEGKEGESETVFLKALETGRSEDPGGLWEFGPLYELTVIHSHRKDYAGAKVYARQMIDVSSRNVGPGHGVTAQAMLTWAPFAAETGEQEAAIAAIMRAMPIIEKSYPSPSLVLWHCARDAAHVMKVSGRFEEAERYARESLVVAQAAHLTPEDPRPGNSWEELGQALYGKRQFGEAIRAFAEAEAIYTRAGGDWLQTAASVRRQIENARKQR